MPNPRWGAALALSMAVMLLAPPPANGQAPSPITVAPTTTAEAPSEPAQPDPDQPEDTQPEDAQPEDAQPEDAQPEPTPELEQPDPEQPDAHENTADQPSVSPAEEEIDPPPAPPPLAIATQRGKRGWFKRPYQMTLRATGGTAPYTWTRVTGPLPPGLRLSAATVRGKPQRVGAWTPTFRVTDAEGRSISRALRFPVRVQLDVTVERVRRSELPYSYRPGCPVGPSRLRLVRLNHLGYDGRHHRGRLVVRNSAVSDIAAVFARALKQGFPIRAMNKVDRYRGSDRVSMRRGNTSAFNCRHVVGNPTRLSQHAYGDAIDINTRENPYVTASRLYPSGSAKYLDRSRYRKGMILPGGPIAKGFASRRWFWGARWSHPDYQHFSSNGR